jgi:hypothetical protein
MKYFPHTMYEKIQFNNAERAVLNVTLNVKLEMNAASLNQK